MDERSRSRVAAGVMLILLGLGLYGIKYIGAVGESVVLIVIGALSLAAYLRTRSYALALIGCVVLGLGVGTFGEDNFRIAADMTQVGLGAGFVLLYLIPLIYERRSHWWPLIPGGVLLLLGFNAWREFREFMTDQGWPLILVIIGVLMVLGAVGGRRARRSS